MPTTADFLNIGTNEDNIFGGPVRILVAQRSLTAYPELISDVLNLATYNPAAGWTDAGHTSTPLALSNGFEVTDWVSQQAGIINQQVGNWNRSATVAFMESRNNIVLDLVHEADGRQTNSDGDQVDYFWNKPEVTEWRVAALFLDESVADGSNIVMDVLPRAKRNGAASETAWDRGNPQTHSVELTPLADPGVPYDAAWYRIRQL